MTDIIGLWLNDEKLEKGIGVRLCCNGVMIEVHEQL